MILSLQHPQPTAFCDYITFTHLADAFIEINLQRGGLTIKHVAHLGIEHRTLCSMLLRVGVLTTTLWDRCLGYVTITHKCIKKVRMETSWRYLW